jgi:hypothetical protein
MAKSPVFLTAGFADAGEREALGRLTSASPDSSIKGSHTSLDHLLLGTAADGMIIKLSFAAGQICARERNRLTGIREPVSNNPVDRELDFSRGVNGAAPVPNSFCPGQEGRTMHKREV